MDKNIITLSEEDIHYIVKEILNEGRLARFLGTAALGGALALGGGVPAQAQKPKISFETLQYFIVDNPQEWETIYRHNHPTGNGSVCFHPNRLGTPCPCYSKRVTSAD